MANAKNTNCKLCGKFLYNVGLGTKYCSECRKQVDAMRDRTSKKAPPKPKEHEKKKSKGPTLQEIMREANKEGLQYAAYCKKHGFY